MKQAPISHQTKSQLSTNSTSETNRVKIKTNSNFGGRLKNVTQLFISIFTSLLHYQNKHAVNKKIPTCTASSVDNGFTKISADQNKVIPKEDLTANLQVDTDYQAALHAETQHAEKTRKNATDNLQKSNELLINNYDYISDIDRQKNHALNLLGSMLLKHKEYSNSQGILRIEGIKSVANNIVKEMNSSNTDRYVSQLLHNCSLPTLSSVFKKIAGELLKKTNNIDFKSPVSFNDLQICDVLVKNKENIIRKIKNDEQLKNKDPVILKNSDNKICDALARLAPPPLTLQLVVRYCALIANDEDAHQMSINNLAKIFAAHLIDSPSLDISAIKDAETTKLGIKKEKEVNQLAESYIAALIHRERRPFYQA